MKTSKFTDSQILSTLKQAEGGISKAPYEASRYRFGDEFCSGVDI